MGDKPKPKPRPPAGLGAAGKTLWTSTVAEYDLRPDELAVLGAAGRTADDLARLEAELKKSDVLTTGSAGQTVVHPLFEAVRQHRRVLTEQLRSIGLPDEQPTAQGSLFALAGSTAARDLANARWRRGA